MKILTKPELTPTRIVRDSSTPQSTRPGQEVNRIGPRRENVMASDWTLDVPVSRSPAEKALLDVVMTFGGDSVQMEAVDIGVSAEGRTAPEVYGRLVEAVGSYLRASGDERAELLRYEPDAWFKFVPPKTVVERLNEAYADDELEPQEREFLDLTREHFSRLDDE